jgi:hypothetical protein
MKELYAAADLPAGPAAAARPDWITVQELAFGTLDDDDSQLERMIRLASQAKVRIPIVRKAVSSQRCSFGQVKEGQTVILDLVSSILYDENIPNKAS